MYPCLMVCNINEKPQWYSSVSVLIAIFINFILAFFHFYHSVLRFNPLNKQLSWNFRGNKNYLKQNTYARWTAVLCFSTLEYVSAS